MEFRLTKNPITKPSQNSKPEGKGLDDLDPQKPDYRVQREKILKHPNYSASELVVLKPGLNKFENNEQAEYLYQMLGNPEVGGYIPHTDGSKEVITNENVLIEVDKDGNEIKDNLFKKYRRQVGRLVV